MPPKRSLSETRTGISTFKDILEDPNEKFYGQMKQSFIDSVSDTGGLTPNEAEKLWQSLFTKFVVPESKSKTERSAIMSLGPTGNPEAIKAKASTKVKKTLAEKKENLDKVLKEQEEANKRLKEAEEEIKMIKGQPLGGVKTKEQFEKEMEDIKKPEIEKRKTKTEVEKMVKNMLSSQLDDKLNNAMPPKDKPTYNQLKKAVESTEKIRKGNLSVKEAKKQLSDLKETEKKKQIAKKESTDLKNLLKNTDVDLGKEIKKGKKKAKNAKEIKDFQDDIEYIFKKDEEKKIAKKEKEEKKKAKTNYKFWSGEKEESEESDEEPKFERRKFNNENQDERSQNARKRLALLKQQINNFDSRHLLRQPPVSGEAEAADEYKKINKKNVKDMNVKQNKTLPKDKLNTKVETPAPTKAFDDEEDKRKKRFLFSSTKITFRRPEDVVRKSRSMLF